MKSSVPAVLEHLARADSEHIHLSRFVAGVAYALEEYERLASTAPKLDRSNEFYAGETLQVLETLRSGVNPPANWLRGVIYPDGGWGRGSDICRMMRPMI